MRLQYTRCLKCSKPRYAQINSRATRTSKGYPKWGKLEGHSRIILKIRGFDQNSSHRQACKARQRLLVSIYHALLHGSISKKVDVYWIDSEKFENGGQQNLSMLKNFEGILASGGFGRRGSEGIKVANFARANNIPHLWYLLWVPAGNCCICKTCLQTD